MQRLAAFNRFISACCWAVHHDTGNTGQFASGWRASWLRTTIKFACTLVAWFASLASPEYTPGFWGVLWGACMHGLFVTVWAVGCMHLHFARWPAKGSGTNAV